jgi:glycosyltransferase involved in cell wall biosynthesis
MNKTASYKLTIIVPVFNEEENIAALEEKLSTYISKPNQSSAHPACVLFIDDGSTDNGLEKIKEACARQTGFFYAACKKNGGLSSAIKAGIDIALSPFIGYIDADLQTTPEDFDLLAPYINDYAMVMGIRTNRRDSFVKSASSKIANGFRRFMTKDGIEDTGCPLKIINTVYAKKIPLFTGMHRFLPALIQLQHGKIKQVPVRHFPRNAGKSKYHLANRLAGPFMDTFAFRWMKKRYINYSLSDDNLS